MARLTKEQWAEIRTTWESDPREGFDWLVAELSLDVSRQAVSKTAKAQGWVKANSTGKVAGKVAQPKSCATKAKKVAQPKAKPQQKPIAKRVIEVEEAEWEEVSEEELKQGRGRPSVYRPEFCELAYECCLIGMTDEGLAEIFGVSEQTINNWKHSYPDFLESITRGKIMADAKVASATFKSAVGEHFVSEDRIIQGVDGQEVVTLKKQIPPDPRSQIWWMKNRQNKLWKDKHEIEVSNKVDKDLIELIKNDRMVKLEAARERQRQVLIERGIVTEEEDV
jgi:transcriptional regulator with XRE-family HTH domain